MEHFYVKNRILPKLAFRPFLVFTYSLPNSSPSYYFLTVLLVFQFQSFIAWKQLATIFKKCKKNKSKITYCNILEQIQKIINYFSLVFFCIDKWFFVDICGFLVMLGKFKTYACHVWPFSCKSTSVVLQDNYLQLSIEFIRQRILQEK